MTVLSKSKGCGLTGTFLAHGLILLVLLFVVDEAEPTPLPPPVEALRISLTEPVAAPEPEPVAQVEPEVPPLPQVLPPPVPEETLPVKKADARPKKKIPPKKEAPRKEQPERAVSPAPAPPKQAPAPDTALRKEARQTLLSALLARIEKEKRYPTAARRLGLEGQVTVTVKVDAQGRIAGIQVQGADAHAVLEKATQEALNRVRSKWTPVPVPEAMTLRIPIKYSLKS